jgi:hypothetical protein
VTAKNAETARKGTKNSLSAILCRAFFVDFDRFSGFMAFLLIVFIYDFTNTIITAYIIIKK